MTITAKVMKKLEKICLSTLCSVSTGPCVKSSCSQTQSTANIIDPFVSGQVLSSNAPFRQSKPRFGRKLRTLSMEYIVNRMSCMMWAVGILMILCSGKFTCTCLRYALSYAIAVLRKITRLSTLKPYRCRPCASCETSNGRA